MSFGSSLQSWEQLHPSGNLSLNRASVVSRFLQVTAKSSGGERRDPNCPFGLQDGTLIAPKMPELPSLCSMSQLPALAEQRSLKKAGAFSSGGFERLRRERVAAVAGVAAALCPEGTQQEKAPSPRRRTPQPRWESGSQGWGH